MGSFEEIDLHSEWRRRKCDGCAPGIHPDKYTVVDTVATFAGAKTIAVDPKTHNAYLFQPERGPAPAPTSRGAPAACARWTWTRPSRSDRGVVVHRDQTVAGGLNSVTKGNRPPNLIHDDLSAGGKLNRSPRDDGCSLIAKANLHVVENLLRDRGLVQFRVMPFAVNEVPHEPADRSARHYVTRKMLVGRQTGAHHAARVSISQDLYP